MNLGIQKTKQEAELEKKLKDIDFSFERIEKRLGKYKDYLIFFKIKGDKVYTVSNFTLELNQKVTMALIYKTIFKEFTL